MTQGQISPAIIRSDHRTREYGHTYAHDGHAEILVSTLPNYNISGFNGITIDEILMIADEHRRCEEIMERHRAEASCDLSLRYGGNTEIYLVGDNITQVSDLEIMARIREESHRESPKRV